MGFKGPEASNVVDVCDYRNLALLLLKKKVLNIIMLAFLC